MDTLKTTVDGNVLRIQLDDGKANVLGTAMLRALLDATKLAEGADAVLLTGRDNVFCGGLDLNEVTSLDGNALGQFLDLFHETFNALYALPRPLVVAVKGSAVAGGAIILAAGDMRLGARDKGIVGTTESRLGLPFPIAALEILRLAINPVDLPRVMVLGELFSKDNAKNVGFFHEVHETEALLSRAEECVKDAAKVSRQAAAQIKHALRKEGFSRIAVDKDESQASFVASWNGSDGQARVQAVMAAMKRR
jgi:enoyl-CoA hydratase